MATTTKQKKRRTSGKGTKRGLLPRGRSNPNSAGPPKGAR